MIWEESKMNKVKITVLKTTLDKELAAEYGAERLFYYGDWIRKPGVAICSCNYGLRPVIFKLEATDEESKIDYTPVR